VGARVVVTTTKNGSPSPELGAELSRPTTIAADSFEQTQNDGADVVMKQRQSESRQSNIHLVAPGKEPSS
jgi:hypothetical protein